METPFNSELIKQFYATLYVSGNPDDTTTWILEWMIHGQVFRMHSQEFMEIVNIPRHTGEIAKVHLLPDPTDAEFASLQDPEVTGDHMPENIRPKHLVFISKAWFYILSQSLMPLNTASDESNIHYHVRHALLKLSHGHVFDFEDCFLRYLVQVAELVHQLKPYERNMSKSFQKEVYHFEVGIRYQQLLENFIEGNQRQMQ